MSDTHVRPDPDTRPDDTFPAQMTALRRNRGLSLRRLARSAGISHDALGSWERGERLPRLPELGAALTALGVSPTEQSRLIALLPTPRALRHTRESAICVPDRWGEAAGPLPGCGDLLRALRGRRGITQVEAARAVGVGQGRLALWERSEDWPASDRLRRLCLVLGATAEETVALTEGRGILPALDEGEDAEAWSYAGPASQSHPIATMLERLYFRADALRDLRFLSVERRLWLRARDSDVFRSHLAGIYGFRTRALLDEGRFAEIGPYAARSWDLARQGYGGQVYWTWGVIASARTLRCGFAGHRPRPAEAAALLSSLVAQDQTRENRAWMLAELALASAAAGQFDEALLASAQSLALAGQTHESVEILFRRRDHAEVLAASGRPGEAMEILETASGLSQFGADPIVRHRLLAAAYSLDLGDAHAARECLWFALPLIDQGIGLGNKAFSILKSQAESLLSRSLLARL